jgi:hypothetical protein
VLWSQAVTHAALLGQTQTGLTATGQNRRDCNLQTVEQTRDEKAGDRCTSAFDENAFQPLPSKFIDELRQNEATIHGRQR